MGEGTPEVTTVSTYHLHTRPVRSADAWAWARLPWPLRVDVEARFPPPLGEEMVENLRVLRLLPVIAGVRKPKRGQVQLDIQGDSWRVVWSAEDGAEAHSTWLPVQHLEVTFGEVQTFIRGRH